MTESKESIFVQIISYRNANLIHTIRSCLTAAKYPERITFGIVHYYDDFSKGILNELHLEAQVQNISFPWREFRGAGHAHSLCETMYQGERFTLQIDQYVHFTNEWDANVVDQWKLCGDEYAILSSPPIDTSSEVQKTVLELSRRIVVVDSYSPEGIPMTSFVYDQTPVDKIRPRRIYFVDNAMFFGRGLVCKEVPCIRDITCERENVVRSLQLFMNGYTFFRPVYELFYSHKIRSEQSDYVRDFIEAGGEITKRYRSIENQSRGSILSMLNLGNGTSKLSKLQYSFQLYVGVFLKERIVHPEHLRGALPPIALDNSFLDEISVRNRAL